MLLTGEYLSNPHLQSLIEIPLEEKHTEVYFFSVPFACTDGVIGGSSSQSREATKNKRRVS